ncbi:MAG: hypothetical protein H7Y00_00140, partial [Fimbriimonadaceae bacterium]|nr:hypothetical protein [Chitinophagales bacterium]
MKNYYRSIFACLCIVINMFSLTAQNRADVLIDHGPCDPIVIIFCPSGVDNPENATDDNLDTYTTLRTNLGILSSSFLEMGFSNPAPGGSIVAVYVGDEVILNVDVLESINLYLLDENDNVIAQKTGLAIADIQLTTDGKGIARIKVPKNETAHAIRITLGGLVSLNNQLDVYGAVHAPAADVVYADYIFAQGPCHPVVPLVCGSGVINADNSVDINKNNYALLTIPLDMTASAFLDLGFSVPGSGGSTVSFICGTNGSPLCLGLLSNLKITIYNSDGQVVKSKNGFSLAEVELIGSDKFKVKVKVPAGASDVARARITQKSL